MIIGCAIVCILFSTAIGWAIGFAQGRAWTESWIEVRESHKHTNNQSKNIQVDIIGKPMDNVIMPNAIEAKVNA